MYLETIIYPKENSTSLLDPYLKRVQKQAIGNPKLCRILQTINETLKVVNIHITIKNGRKKAKSKTEFLRGKFYKLNAELNLIKE